MNSCWLLPLSLLSGQDTSVSCAPMDTKPVGVMIKVDLPELRLRDARRHVRNLRLDIEFTQRRIADLPVKRSHVEHTLPLIPPDECLLAEITEIFAQRELRLRERLGHMQTKLEHAEDRLRRLGGQVLPPVPPNNDQENTEHELGKACTP